ncbi:hypothetical protein RI030_13980 [Aphanizomenon flos-aquae NRERC-008]|jgi:hypothetical protein|uniref:Uncharacterized protein n=1 Tax=Aphanizomenon flos-aquae FACHB-1249 TaxID=2692889 RepID=A0ABR8IW03_APHFL|nr:MULTISPECIES: hypothetical protein [Aphanizomenon]MCE2906183.1 hypothetical protein [Anabaena sp. CoA2_C59]MDJ0505299.1 hypothetical protein [Nostocales cyanobacterium LE14-WE12]MBD2392191.1 hypothetical protein [Aphanizomenon flos-aquae FACHB-1171]MBD2558101.1 hypothetical protein [Aphanizomenon flos-aquae FACHB-1290]MBD2633102.1 hypothetical protein [Aphanizomenon sp. FACHB-1399]
MAERLLQLDDVLNISSSEKIANLFQKLGYNSSIQALSIDDLHLSTRSTEAIDDLKKISGYKQ